MLNWGKGKGNLGFRWERGRCFMQNKDILMCLMLKSLNLQKQIQIQNGNT